MSDPSSASVRFSGSEQQQLVRYRAMSKLAILALLLGLAAVLSLVHPLLLMIPAAGAVCAVVALRTIRANPEQWTGAGLATVGLVLSLFFLGWGLGWTATRPGRLAEQARTFADDWLRLVQKNQLHAAHQLRQPASTRAPLTSRLAEYYSSQPPDAQEIFRDFADSPAIQALVKAGPENPPEFRGVASSDHSGVVDTVTLRYRLPAANDQPMWSIHITASRSAAEGNQWQISAIDGREGEDWPE